MRDLRRSYGTTEVLRGISFAVRRGELFGLLGTNGAGKTTTVEILQGLRRPDGGSVSVLGLDPRVGRRPAAPAHRQPAPGRRPARSHAGAARRCGSSPRCTPRPSRSTSWPTSGSSTHLRRRPFAALSGGERQRLFVALALVGRPELVFLDELTQNLDPVGRRHTWDVVRRVRDAGTTVVLVTHDVEEAERLCDRIVVLDRGRVVADGTPAAIIGDARRHARRCASPTPSSTSGRCGDLPGVDARRPATGSRSPSRAPGRCSPTSAPTSSPSAVPPLDLRVDRPTLEERFVALTTRRTTDDRRSPSSPARAPPASAGAPHSGSPPRTCGCWSASRWWPSG